jgi:hypothetical protein
MLSTNLCVVPIRVGKALIENRGLPSRNALGCAVHLFDQR